MWSLAFDSFFHSFFHKKEALPLMHLLACLQFNGHGSRSTKLVTERQILNIHNLNLHLLACLQLKGHGSRSELAELGARRSLKVLLAEDNLINMKVSGPSWLHDSRTTYCIRLDILCCW